MTAVHQASYVGNVQILSLLIEAGGDLRLHDGEGLSARDWINKQGDTKKRRLLVGLLEQIKQSALNQSGDDLLETSIYARYIIYYL